MIRRAAQIAESVLALIAVGCAAAIAWWATMDSAKPSVIFSAVATPHKVQQAGVLTVDYSFNRRRTCHTEVLSYIIGSDGSRSPTITRWITVTGTKLGAQDLKINYPLPPTVPLGPATYQVLMRWRCNPWHSFMPIEQTLKPVPFEVVPAPRLGPELAVEPELKHPWPVPTVKPKP